MEKTRNVDPSVETKEALHTAPLLRPLPLKFPSEAHLWRQEKELGVSVNLIEL